MTKHLSKIFGLLMVLVVALILVACGEKVDEPEQFTVTFVCEQGVAFNPPTRTVIDGQTTTPPTFNRPGYTATWYTNSERTIPKNFETGTVTSDMNIYVRWTPIGVETFTVTFVGGTGATNVPAQLTNIASGAIIAQPANPTRDGHTFIGWFTAAEGGTQWNFATSTVTASISLFARWEAIAVGTVTVTFNPNEGVLTSPVTVEVDAGDYLPTITAPTREGYEFTGWWTTPVEGGRQWNIILEAIPANMTLYARWVVPAVFYIRTAQELFDVFVGARPTAGLSFALAGNIDFATVDNFEWVNPTGVGSEFPFAGTFDGQGYTISNLAITAEAGARAALIPAAGTSSISNLVIRNVTVTAPGGESAGILIARTEPGAAVSISNITIINSSVSTTGGRGAAAIIGRVRGSANVANTIDIDGITILNTSISTTAQSAGAIIGDVTNQTVNISNILVDADVLAGTDQAGGVIGNLRGEGGGTQTPNNTGFSIENAIVRVNVRSNRADALQPNTVGGLIGRIGQNVPIVRLLDAEGQPVIVDDEYVYIHLADARLSNIILIPHLTGMRPAGQPDLNWIGRADALSATSYHSVSVEDVYVVAPNFFAANRDAVVGSNVQNTRNTTVTGYTLLANTDALTVAHFAGFLPADGWATASIPTLNGNAVALGHRVTLVGATTTYQYVRAGETLRDVRIARPNDDQVLRHWLLATALYDMSTPVVAPLTLNAAWLDIFTVSFDSAGGSAVANVRVDDGNLLTLPANPTRTGYRFSHWVDFVAETPITANISFTAYWIPQVRATFDVVGGPTVIQPVYVDVNTAVARPEVVPIRGGWLFQHWALAGDATETEFDFATQLTENTTFVAIWDIDPNAETFRVDFTGVGIVPFYEMVTPPELITIPPTPTRTDYRFVDWLFNDVAWDFSRFPESVMTLVASWEEATGLVIPAPHPDTIAITNATELFALTVGDHSGIFHLANDINFSGYEFEWVNGMFTGTLNGLGHRIIGLSTNRTNGHGGLFQILGSNALIENIIFVDADIATHEGGGLVARETDPGATNIRIRNISVINSKLTNTTTNQNAGTAGLIGFVINAELTIDNIYMNNFDVVVRGYATTGTLSNARHAAFIIGRVGEGPTDITANVIRISNVVIVDSHINHYRTSVTNAEARVAAIIAQITRQRAVINNVVIIDTHIQSVGHALGIIGRIEQNYAQSSTINNVFFNGTIQGVNSGYIVGQRALNVAPTNVFMVDVTRLGSLHDNNDANTTNLLATQVASFPAIDWWDRELVSIVNAGAPNHIFNWDSNLGVYTLLRPFVATYIPGVVRHTVIFAGEGIDIPASNVVAGATLILPTNPERAGYRFAGWLLDGEEFVAATMPINRPITLTADWRQQVTVTFETGEGSNVSPREVDINTALAALPYPNPTLAGHRFAGWYTDSIFETAFVATALIEKSVTLYARWQPVITVSFDTGDADNISPQSLMWVR